MAEGDGSGVRVEETGFSGSSDKSSMSLGFGL